MTTATSIGMTKKTSLRIDQLFRAEYAKSGRSRCKKTGCGKTINEYELRIASKVKSNKFDGKLTWWYHFDCFFKVHRLQSTGDLAHFSYLKYQDQKRIEDRITRTTVKRELDSVNEVDEPNKKIKQEKELEEKLKQQSDQIHSYIDKLKELKTSVTDEILKHNGYVKTKDRYYKIERLADAMLFGALEKCPQCKVGQIYLRNGGYICHQCDYESMEHGRKPFSIPKKLRRKYPFLDECLNNKKKRIMPKIQEPIDSLNPLKGKPNESPSFSGSQGLVRQNIHAIHPYYEDTYCILKEGDVVYSEVLYKANLWQNSNSYYKIQILADKVTGNLHLVYRDWGRIGTNIGDFEVDELCEDETKAFFESLFERKTGNFWSNRANFVPELHHYQRTEEIQFSLSAKEKLISIIFDTALIEQEMQKLAIKDPHLWPLGFISQKNIQSAQEILTKINAMIDSGEAEDNPAKLMKPSEDFYNLIPHDVGSHELPPICTSTQVQEKIEMLDVLRGVAVTLGMTSDVKKEGAPLGIFDEYYKKLRTELTEVKPDDLVYNLIQEYCDSSKDSPHRDDGLRIKDIFKVERDDEKNLHLTSSNKMLLWHGSPVTNFARILSQGPKIAPANVKISGHTFGEGIYFADMATKSAGYCCAGESKNIGLILLCEVALGNMKELYDDSQNNTGLGDGNRSFKPPEGLDSVKGVGLYTPISSKFIEYSGEKLFFPETYSEKTIEVPCGPVHESGIATGLLGNEYVLYKED